MLDVAFLRFVLFGLADVAGFGVFAVVWTGVVCLDYCVFFVVVGLVILCLFAVILVLWLWLWLGLLVLLLLVWVCWVMLFCGLRCWLVLCWL